MSLDDLVQMSITASSSTPTVQGFGTPLVMVNKVPASWGAAVQRTYADLASMVTDGFLVSDPGYLGVNAAFSQSPRPPNVIVGKRLNKTVQTFKLTCLSAVQGDVYTITVNGTLITYTVLAAATTTTVAAALASLVGAVAGVTAVAAVAVITITATAGAGVLNRLQSWTRNFLLNDLSADPGIVADLTAVQVANFNWYGLTLDSCSKAEIVAAAAWAESNKKFFCQQTSDGDTENVAVTTCVMSTIVAGSYSYTGLLYNANDTMAFAGLALQGKRFAATPIPGNETYALNTLAGVFVDSLPQSSINAITAGAKKGMVYVTIAGLNVTQAGTAGNTGVGQWLDVVRYVDWVRVTMQSNVFGKLVTDANTLGKTPFTDVGIDSVGGVIRNVLEQGAANGGGVASTNVVNVPKVANIDPTTKAQRKLSQVTFSQQLQGAIGSVAISGTVYP
jgi:hypothetical protein